MKPKIKKKLIGEIINIYDDIYKYENKRKEINKKLRILKLGLYARLNMLRRDSKK